MPRFDPQANQLVVAMDHARYFGCIRGLEQPEAVLEAVIDGGADAVMTSFGVVRHFRERLVARVPTLMRLDGGFSQYREEWLRPTRWELLNSVDDARALGVDGVCLMLFVGSEVELDNMSALSEVAAECAHDGLTVMVEALPCPAPSIPDPMAPEAMADAARLAFEHGADVVKSYYTGEPRAFRQVSGASPAPVLIAGGPRADSERAVVSMVADAVGAGAKGVVFGRNIWQSQDPGAMVRALRAVIHEGADAERAAKELAPA